MSPVLAVASKEFRDGLRNRWFISITLIFLILSVGLTYFGSVASGSLGVASLSTTIASLSSLAVFIIPLIALLLCYDSFVGEQEGGTLLLLLTYPLSKTELLLGKFIGQGGITALATLLGFGASALVMIADSYSMDVIVAFTRFICSAILLGWVFISMAYLVSLSVSEKSKAAGLTLIIWFLFVLVFDLALLAVLVGVEDLLNQETLVTLMMLNPADVFRLVNLVALGGENANGVLSIAMSSNLSPTTLMLVLTLWVIAPLLASNQIFKLKHF
ncbi:ABC transporter permease [Vibrio sp. HN007]|uniref:ABC transporter permease n=1 Tax=Vibrio iocasae TaxID=3098914 RepID=UPI0035D406E9